MYRMVFASRSYYLHAARSEPDDAITDEYDVIDDAMVVSFGAKQQTG